MSSAPDPIVQSDTHEDAVRAIRFLAVKAAIFIAVPFVAAMAAVWWRFG